MKRIQLFALAAALMMAAACSEPLDEAAEEATPQNEAVATTFDVRTVADVNMERFAEILSKAVAQNRDLRVFFKEQATEKIDNDYNVFYPIAKRKAVGGETMEQMLAKYADETELAEIQAAVPLLNVHLPELAGSTVADLDPDDEELPVLYNNVMYYDGEPIDTLAADEVPGFNILVVTESTSIRKRSGLSKSASALALDDEYEYVDVAFKPDGKSLSKSYGLVETLSSKYTGDYVSTNLIDPIVVTAAKNANANSNKKATRAFVYYGMTNLNQTPTIPRSDVREMIFRFKIDGPKATICTDYASAYGQVALYTEYENKGGTLLKNDVLPRLLTGRAYGIKFVFEEFSNGKCTGSEYISFQVQPTDLFNVYVGEKITRHKTKFRHSKYLYTIDPSKFESKWFYPMEHGSSDARFNSIHWNLTNGEPYERCLTVFVENPLDGITTENTVKNSVSIVDSKKLTGSLSVKLKKIIDLGLSGELSNSSTYSNSFDVKTTINHHNKEIAKIALNFFDSYPIESISGSQCQMQCISNSGVSVDLVPISNNYFMNKYKNKR